jgi:hypothetical protein
MFPSDKNKVLFNQEIDSILIPLKLIEELKDFDTWKEFKNNPDFLINRGSKIVKTNKKQTHFDDPWDNYSGTHFGY